MHITNVQYVSQQDRSINNESEKFSVQGHLFVYNRVCDVAGSGGGINGRSAVKQFSSSSAARMRRYLRTSLCEYTYFITLTYPHNYTRDGRESKEHLRRFLQELKRKCIRDGHKKYSWGCFWFMEFQKRGAIHYHIFCSSGVDRRWLSSTWYEICGTEDPRHLAAGTNIEKIRSGKHGVCSYASKYAAKCDQKVVPNDMVNCGRFWGVTGYRAVMAADTVVTPQNRDAETIVKSKNAIKRHISGCCLSGTARYLVKSNDVVVVYFKKSSDAVKCLHLVDILAVKVSMFTGKSRFMREIEEIYSDELGVDGGEHGSKMLQQTKQNQEQTIYR